MPFKIGSDTIGDIYVGSDKIGKIYCGNDLVYTSQQSGKQDFILGVSKVVRNTYTSSQTYTDDKFVGLVVNVEDGKTATVNYGGITKTLSSGSNTVTFGKYMGVDDETPDSGQLTISGDFYNVQSLSTLTAKSTSSYVPCVTSIIQWFGNQVTDTSNMFREQTNLTITSPLVLPETITELGAYMFYKVPINTSLTALGVTNIGDYALNGVISIPTVDFSHDGLVSVGNTSFPSGSGQCNGDIYLAHNFVGSSTPSRNSGNVYYLGTLTQYLSTTHFTNQGNFVVDNLYINGQLVTGLNIPNGITTIPPYSFAKVKSFNTQIVLPSGLTVGANAFAYSNIVINSSLNLQSVGGSAFANCSNANITNLTVNDRVGASAFRDCLITGQVVAGTADAASFVNTNITIAVVGSGIQTGSSNDIIFKNCPNLVQLSITSGNYDWIASDCASLTDATIGPNVTSIGSHCLSNLPAIKRIDFNAIYCTYNDTLTPSHALLSVGANDNIVNLIIGNKVKEIPAYLCYNNSYIVPHFGNATSLERVRTSAFSGGKLNDNEQLPNSLKTIDDSAFRDTHFITNYTTANPYYLPTSLETIGNYALQNAGFYTTSSGYPRRDVIIPASCTNIGTLAFFSGSVSLNVHFMATDVTVINLDMYAFKRNASSSTTSTIYYFKATESNVTSWAYWTTDYFENTIYTQSQY